MSTYKNAMELLVEEEVSHQFKALPAKTASYINQTELVAYALNQLPSLYATSEKGLEHQLQRGKAKYAPQVTQAVKRAIAAVQRDPLRAHTPLQSQQSAQFREVLHQLRMVLKNDKLDWHTLPDAVEQALDRASHGSGKWDARQTARAISGYPALRRSSPFPGSAAEQQSSRQSEGRKTRQEEAAAQEERRGEVYGWDDPLYHSS
jgi:hypothetical protein